MKRFELEVEAREKTGKGAARKLRKDGLIPGVVYGKKIDSTPLIVDPTELQNKINQNVIIDLKIKDKDDAQEEIVLIKDYQKDVIKDKIIHVDFQQISMDEKINVSVPLRLTGSSPGVDEGGVLQQLLKEIEIEALPDDVPGNIELDISELDVGDSLQVDDLEVEENIDIVESLEEVIVTVVTPTEEPEEEIELEEEFVEPEVIGAEDEEIEEGEEPEEVEEPEETEEEEETEE